MNAYRINLETWDYAVGGHAHQERVVLLLAREYNASPDAVREVLEAHRGRVNDLYEDTRNKPSLAALEANDEVCLEALGNLEKIEEEELA